jgi:hypothetical protein
LDQVSAGGGGFRVARAQPITCLFYVYREGTAWNLVDLTTPKKEKITTETGGSETELPLELFDRLNTRLRFPKGRLYWEMPDGSIRVLVTTEPWSLSDWLQWVGLGLAVLGITAATLGAGTPATLLLVGSALAGAGAAAADITEKSSVGVLTPTDVLIDAITIIGSLAAAGGTAAGRVIVSGAFKTGSAARFATYLDARVYLPLVGVNLVADAANFIVASYAAMREYREVAASGDGQARDLALRRLVMQLLVTGGMTLLAVKGNIADFRRGQNLYLDLDLGSDAIARPLRSEAELTAMLRTRPGVSNSDELARLLARTDVDEELALRIRADLTQALDNGLLGGESLQRVLSAMRTGAKLENIRQGLAELRHANRVAMAGGPAAGSRMHIGVRKGATVDLGNGRTIKIDYVDEVDLLYLGADNKIHLEEVKHTAQGLVDKLKKKPRQFESMQKWLAADPSGRAIRVGLDTAEGWTDLFGETAAMKKMIAAGVTLDIAGRTWSPTRMQTIWDTTAAKAKSLGMWPKPGTEFFDRMATLDQAEGFLGISLR